MKIKNNSMKISTIFDLENGDIFLYEDGYYIAGEIDWCGHVRICYDLSNNIMFKFYDNKSVVAWDRHECELIIG